MILPVREEERRRGRTDLVCPGKGCDARLGIRQGLLSPGTTLESGYTYEPNERYRPGTWWRLDLKERLRRRPRAKDLRKRAAAQQQKGPFTFSPPGLPFPSEAGPGIRRPPRVPLRSGSHIVVCDKCEQAASIEVEPPTGIELPVSPFRLPDSPFR